MWVDRRLDRSGSRDGYGNRNEIKKQERNKLATRQSKSQDGCISAQQRNPYLLIYQLHAHLDLRDSHLSCLTTRVEVAGSEAYWKTWDMPWPCMYFGVMQLPSMQQGSHVYSYCVQSVASMRCWAPSSPASLSLALASTVGLSLSWRWWCGTCQMRCSSVYEMLAWSKVLKLCK